MPFILQPPPELIDKAKFRIIKTLNGFGVEKRFEYYQSRERKTFLWGFLGGDLKYDTKSSWLRMTLSGDVKSWTSTEELAEFDSLEAAEDFIEKVIQIGKVIKTYQ